MKFDTIIRKTYFFYQLRNVVSLVICEIFNENKNADCSEKYFD